jgi:hypothetical protein
MFGVTRRRPGRIRIRISPYRIYRLRTQILGLGSASSERLLLSREKISDEWKTRIALLGIQCGRGPSSSPIFGYYSRLYARMGAGVPVRHSWSRLPSPPSPRLPARLPSLSDGRSEMRTPPSSVVETMIRHE